MSFQNTYPLFKKRQLPKGSCLFLYFAASLSASPEIIRHIKSRCKAGASPMPCSGFLLGMIVFRAYFFWTYLRQSSITATRMMMPENTNCRLVSMPRVVRA